MKIIRNTPIILIAALCLMSWSGQAIANSGSKEAGASAAVPTARMEPFTVNLASFDRYLQLSIALQIASGEVAEKIKLLMPVLRHKLILILSNKESELLRSPEGKHQLVEEIKESVNQTLEFKERDGITDVFFENFVIQ
ncbi:MAG: flagellar basal body-associated FliL family protein [Burkholderiales bacterium]|nr:flagellar basal body-associated FliL family protein [Burkholderiales bacterium]